MNLNFICELLSTHKSLQIIPRKISDNRYANGLNLSLVSKSGEYRSQQNPNCHTKQVQRRDPAMFLYEAVHGSMGFTNIGPFVGLLAQARWQS